MNLFLKYWLPLVAWLALIFIGSTDLMSAEQTSRIIGPILRWLNPNIFPATIAEVQFFVRKAAHVTEYAILAIFAWRALRGGGIVWNPRMSVLFLTVSLVCAAFAAVDEFHQSFVPSRTASSADVMIDICGALVGLTIYVAVAGRKVLKEKRV